MIVKISPSPLGYHLYDLWVNGTVEIRGECFAVVSSVQSSLWGTTRGAELEADEIAHNICQRRGLRRGGR